MPTSTFTPDRTLEDVRRLPRSFIESPNFKPDWRNSQAQLYVNEIREGGLQQLPSLPSWEDDDYVRDQYYHRLGVLSKENNTEQVLHWLDELQSLKDPKPLARFKARLIAGRSDEEIAEQEGVLPAYVDYFEKLYFNVRPLSNIHHKVTLLKPYELATSDKERLEKLYLTIALHGSAEELDAYLDDNVALSCEMGNRFDELMCGNLISQGFGATVLDRATQSPNSGDIDRALKLRRPGRRDRGDGGQAEAAISGVEFLQKMIEALWGGEVHEEAG